MATLLGFYERRLEQGSVPMPVGGLCAASHAASLSASSACLLLLGDKAFNHLEELKGIRDPHVPLHGSFSFMANLHAARLHALSLRGFTLQTPYVEGFKCAALWLPGSSAARSSSAASTKAGALPPRLSVEELLAAEEQLLPSWALQLFPRLTCAWADSMDVFCPDDFANLQRCVRDEIREPSLKTILTALRMSCWDSEVFLKFKQTLIERAPAAGEKLQADLYRDCSNVMERHFLLSQDKDVSFEVGRICMGLRRYAEAINLFLASSRQTGEHQVTTYNMGICLFHVKAYAASSACFRRALTLKPDYKDAATWLARVGAAKAEEEKKAAAAAAAEAAAATAAAAAASTPAEDGGAESRSDGESQPLLGQPEEALHV